MLLSGCNGNGTHTPDVPTPKADFSFAETILFAGSTVQFENTSTNVTDKTTYLWDFGDGGTSANKNATHIFENAGVYKVTLMVKNGTQERKKAKEISISLREVTSRESLRTKLPNLGNKILVCAHRASHANAPENSLKAIQHSIDNKIAFVEVDIRQTKDGKFVLMHDETIDHTTNGNGKVKDKTLEELKKLNLEHNGILTSEKIPTLEEVLELSRGKIYLDLDVKVENLVAIFNIVKMYGMVEQTMFTVNKISLAKSLVSADNRAIVMPIIDTQAEFDTYTNASLNLVVLHYSKSSFVKTLIDQAHDKKIQVFRLVYVNSSTTPDSDNYQQIDNLIKLGGNIIQTDYPNEVKTHLRNNNLNE